MKRALCAMGVATFLTACGGGGSSSDSDTPDPTKTNSLDNPTSVMYQASLKTFAEVWTSFDLVMTVNDLAMFAGETGNCPSGGSLAYSNGVQTMNKCLRRYPADQAYSGSFKVFNTSGMVYSDPAFPPAKLTEFTNVQALDTTTFAPMASITVPSYLAIKVIPGTNSDTVELNTPGPTFSVGTKSTYIVPNMNIATVNDGTTQTITKVGSIGSYLYMMNKGDASYNLDLLQEIKISGDARPNTGAVNVTYSTSTACSPMKIRFISATQFGLSCPNDSAQKEVIKNWTDADVKTALATAQQ
jgi:hypothetical protein